MTNIEEGSLLAINAGELPVFEPEVSRRQPRFPVMKIAYFVHDLNDPAVHRRLRMLRIAKVDVVLFGFYRGNAPALVENLAPVILGKTEDARLGRRMLAILRAEFSGGRWQSALRGIDGIIARQLEMLLLASRARDRVAPTVPLVYECLDIHRLTAAPRIVGRALRFLEGRLLGRCQTLAVSSPEFISSHFGRRYRDLPRVLLMENKIIASELASPVVSGLSRTAVLRSGPPWRIGWFGMIRCRRSLLVLAALASQGMAEVIIRGKIAYSVIPDFDTLVAKAPNVRYLGPYNRRLDLDSIYGEVHFTWAIDYYEEGANSDWLLPNRIYEGGLFGSVPIARDGCATADWLRRHSIGVNLTGDIGPSLNAFIEDLDQARYYRLAADIRALPRTVFLDYDDDCATLINALFTG